MAPPLAAGAVSRSLLLRPAPGVALAAGALSAAAAAGTRATAADAAAWAVAALALGLLAAIDLATRRLPNPLTGALAAGAIGARALLAPAGLVEALVAGAAVTALFLAFAAAARGGLGMGDVKLAGALGLLLGEAVVPALLIGAVLGAVASAVALLRARGARRTSIAYGPYLCLGGVIAIVVTGPPPLS